VPDVQIPPLSLDRFESLLSPTAQQQFAQCLKAAGERLGEGVLWHVNSTAQGGGVAEMLRSLLGYLQGAGIKTHWHVIEGGAEFFEVTKRVHNRLHGHAGDRGRLEGPERGVYDTTLVAAAARLTARVRPGDVVVLHDPQTAGLAPVLKHAGARVIWACHVGIDQPNDVARSAWQFLRPDVHQADAHVFSRRAYAWEGLDEDKVAVIPPCIDAFSPKNAWLDAELCESILQTVGLLAGAPARQPRFHRQDGSQTLVRASVELTGRTPLPRAAPVVLQVSRWDRLKDPTGVLRAFVDHVPAHLGAHLVLAGPAAQAVTDDPEGAEVLTELLAEHDRLPAALRMAVHIACLPMHDLEENAAIVNALQRRADVIVQKSLAEGFGLTVAEGMWKQRPVVGSRVGGIQDQIVHDESGLLIDDPADLPLWGKAVTELLADPDKAAHLGRRARQRVSERYLPPSHLGAYSDLLERVLR
jgi:trehalose synthase